MANIHITLVGREPAPVHNGLKKVDCEQIVFVYSTQSEENANHISTMVQEECNTKRCSMVKCDPVDIDKVYQCARKLAENYQGETISVNITGGTKVWSLIFYDVFLNAGARVFYIDQNNKIWDFAGSASKVPSPLSGKNGKAIDMDEHLKLHNAKLKSYKTLGEFTKEDEKALGEIEAIRAFNYEDFNKLTVGARLDKLEQRKSVPSGSYLSYDKAGNMFELYLKNRNGKEKKKCLSSPHIAYLLLNSGWFEYKVALLLSKWKDVEEIRLDCVFSTKTNKDNNQVDIIAGIGEKLLFVECKTQINQITDIDKFNSVVNTYGGKGSKSLFVTDAQMRPEAKSNCKRYDIIPFSLQNENLGLLAETALAMILNSEIMNINK